MEYVHIGNGKVHPSMGNITFERQSVRILEYSSYGYSDKLEMKTQLRLKSLLKFQLFEFE